MRYISIYLNLRPRSSYCPRKNKKAVLHVAFRPMPIYKCKIFGYELLDCNLEMEVNSLSGHIESIAFLRNPIN